VGKLKAIIDSGIRSGIDKPQPPRQMPDEAARQAIRPTEKTIDDFSNEDSFYRIVDEDAYIDLVNSGAVRTNFGNKPGSTIKDKLASRPTRYPSFSKGSANKTYAEGKPNHYIIETKDPSIKPSTEGRHGKGTTQFPTDSTGVHLESLPGEAVQVYRHIGDGQYRLVYDQGKVTPNATNAETNVAAPLGNISIPIAAAIAAGTMTPQEAQAGPVSKALAELAKRADAGDEAARQGIRGYHGSPYNFPPVRELEMPDGAVVYQSMDDAVPEGARVIKEHPLGRFDMSKIGTGEGAQAYGRGLYFAESEDVARGYRKKLSRDNLAQRAKDNQSYDTLVGLGLDESPELGAFSTILSEADGDMARAIQDSMTPRYPDDPLPAFAQSMADAMKSGRLPASIELPTLNKGSMYEVNIDATPDDFLDYDKPLSEQSDRVKEALGIKGQQNKLLALQEKSNELQALYDKALSNVPSNPSFDDLFGDSAALRSQGELLTEKNRIDEEIKLLTTPKDFQLGDRKIPIRVQDYFSGANLIQGQGAASEISKQLLDKGIKGIKYLDQGSRPAGKGTSNYVVFDDKLISIAKKYGVSIPIAAYIAEGIITPEEAQAVGFGSVVKKSLSDKTDEIQQGIGSLPAGDEMVTGGDLQFLMNKLVREQSVKQAKEQGLASNPFATGITGLGAMAALPPEEAQAGPLSAAGRAAQKGFTKDVYHGTTQDFDQVDPDAVDLGIHVGTPAQAANRLRDTTGNRFSGSYDEGANIMPLKARMNNTLEMEDAGDWKDSYQVLGSLRNTPVGRKNRAKIQEMEEQADEIMGQYAYGDEEWRDSPENRELLDEINTMLADSGYDSIRYKNQVENTYGSSAGLTPQAEQRKAAISKEINALDRKLYARKPDMPAMDDPDLAAKMDAFLSFDANKERTPADAARRQQLLDENMAISEDPANQADTNSYIILDPDANLRSRNAQFMDERGNLLASVGTGLGVAVAAGSAPEAQAGSIMTGVNLAKEVALKNLATRVNKGELSASEARALSSFVNNSVSPDTLIQGGYLNPNNMDPGQIKAATTRYIKALEDNPMLRRREGIGGARDPSSTEFYPAEMNDPRIILPEDLLGEILMPNVGDTTQIGVLTKFGGYDLPEGVPSHGGPGFPQQMEELGRPYGWASNQGAANAKVAGFNKVATDTNQQPIAVVTSMGEEAQLFASPYAHAWILKAQELNMPKKQAAKFDAEVRRGVPNKDPKKKAIISPFPEWVGINHPDAKAQLLGGPSPTREGVTYPSVGGRRKSVLLTANKNVEWRNSGLPSLGDLHKGLQINPNETAFEVGRSGYSMYTPEIGVPTEPIDFHQAYDTAIRGKYKGQIEGVTVPGRVMFPDIVKAYTDRGKTEAMAIGGFMANPNIYQKADQRWLDGIRDYLDNLPPVDRDNIIKALPALGVTSAGLAALGIALAPSDASASDIQANQGLVPFDKDIHTPRDVGFGGPSTEYTMTVDAPDGQVAVIPSIWWDTNGEPVVLDQRDAERRSFEYEQETGKQFPRFPAGGYELADEYAQARTRQGGASESPLASEYPSLGGMGVTSRAMPDEVAFKAPMPDEVAFKAPREPRRIPPKQPPGIASLAGQLGLGAMSEIGGAIFGGLAGAAEYGRGSGPSMGGMAGAPATAESIRNINEGVSGYVGDLYDAGPEAQALGQQIMQGIGETIAPIAEYAMEGDITDEYGINMLPLLAQKLGIPLYELLERVYSMMPEREQEALKSGADAFL
jgi:hypothetical protein